VTYRSDKADGPTAGTATVGPLEFLARLVTHIPDPAVITRILAHRARAREPALHSRRGPATDYTWV
jgi:hypothetical protein